MYDRLLNNSLFSKHKFAIDATISEIQFADCIDKMTSLDDKNLVNLLYERHPIYKGRSTNVVVKMRGYAIAAFHRIGLPKQGLPYVLEVLESSFHPYIVAAAARAIRGLNHPNPQIGSYLIKAFYNIWQVDEPVSFAGYTVKWPLKEFSTALIEIFETLTWMGTYAHGTLNDLEIIASNFRNKLSQKNNSLLLDTITAIKKDPREIDQKFCCDISFVFPDSLNRKDLSAHSLRNKVCLEDQSGNLIKWEHYFKGKPTIVAFFYTRCTNPKKCTLTIQNLVRIQNEMKTSKIDEQVKTAAITYDPKYDTPYALKIYGEARCFNFSDNDRMFRVTKGFDILINSFNLGVNYNGSSVNQHRIELFILNADGVLVKSYLRTQIETLGVVNELKDILTTQTNQPIRDAKSERFKVNNIRAFANSMCSIILPVCIAFFPKCPMCWLAYMSVLGVVGLDRIPYSPWLLPVLIFLLITNLYFLYRTAKRRNGLIPVILCAIGSVSLIFSYIFTSSNGVLLYSGISFLLVGSMLHSLSYKLFNKLKIWQLNYHSQFRLSYNRNTGYSRKP